MQVWLGGSSEGCSQAGAAQQPLQQLRSVRIPGLRQRLRRGSRAIGGWLEEMAQQGRVPQGGCCCARCKACLAGVLSSTPLRITPSACWWIQLLSLLKLPQSPAQLAKYQVDAIKALEGSLAVRCQAARSR